MWICEKCNETYTDDCVGEETVCACGGELVRAKMCEGCGEWVDETEPICKWCLDNLEDIDTMVRFGKDNKTTLKLNSFIVSHFDDNEIENILLSLIKYKQLNGEDVFKDFVEEMRFEIAKWHLRGNK